jgi:hypothetical protein
LLRILPCPARHDGLDTLSPAFGLTQHIIIIIIIIKKPN